MPCPCVHRAGHCLCLPFCHKSTRTTDLCSQPSSAWCWRFKLRSSHWRTLYPRSHLLHSLLRLCHIFLFLAGLQSFFSHTAAGLQDDHFSFLLFRCLCDFWQFGCGDGFPFISHSSTLSFPRFENLLVTIYLNPCSLTPALSARIQPNFKLMTLLLRFPSIGVINRNQHTQPSSGPLPLTPLLLGLEQYLHSQLDGVPQSSYSYFLLVCFTPSPVCSTTCLWTC